MKIGDYYIVMLVLVGLVGPNDGDNNFSPSTLLTKNN